LSRQDPTDSTLTKLDRQAVAAEESADEVRWRQAEEVARRLAEGETQRAVAADWLNAKTGKSVAQDHVRRYAQLWRDYERSQDRPSFAPAYAGTVPSRTEQSQAQVPTTPETARKFVENLHKAPPEVVDILRTALPEVEPGPLRAEAGPRKLREEKEAEAAATQSVGPLRRVLGGMALVLALEVARDEARELADLTPEIAAQAEAVLEEIRVEIEVKLGIGELA
jgi:hypothetical protein